MHVCLYQKCAHNFMLVMNSHISAVLVAIVLTIAFLSTNITMAMLHVYYTIV